MKSLRIRSYSGPYLVSECRKIRTRIAPNTDTLNAVVALSNKQLLVSISQISSEILECKAVLAKQYLICEYPSDSAF